MAQAPLEQIPVAAVAPSPISPTTSMGTSAAATGDQFTLALHAALQALTGSGSPTTGLPLQEIAALPTTAAAPANGQDAATVQSLAEILASAEQQAGQGLTGPLTPELLAQFAALNGGFLLDAEGTASDATSQDEANDLKSPEQPTTLAQLLAPLLGGVAPLNPTAATGDVALLNVDASKTSTFTTSSSLSRFQSSIDLQTTSLDPSALKADSAATSLQVGDQIAKGPTAFPSLGKLDSGSLRTLGNLPLSLLPPESRVLPARLFGDRFSRYFSQDQNAPTVQFNPSILTTAEQQATNSTVEDRNATVLARVDRAEFVQRISDALERAHAQSPKSLELELNPPSLGRVKLQIIRDEGQLVARFETESSTTCSLLSDQMPVLTRHLEQQGIQIQRFDVSQANGGVFSGDGRQGGGQNPPQQQQRENQAHTPTWQQTGDEDGRAPPWTVGDLLGLAVGMNRLI